MPKVLSILVISFLFITEIAGASQSTAQGRVFVGTAVLPRFCESEILSQVALAC